jgi:CHAT domain-containing protein
MTRHRKAWWAVAFAAGAAVCFSPGLQPASRGLEPVQSAAPGAPRQQPAASTPSTPAPPPSPSDPGKEIDELIQKADHAMNVDVQFQKCAQFAQQALDLSEKAGDKRREAWALTYLSAAVAGQGRLAEAFEIAQRDVTVARESGDNKILEQALNSAGGTAGESGRYQEALAYFFQCLGLARKIGDQTMEYMSLLNIGEGYSRSGEPERAEEPLRESLRIAGELKRGDLHGGNPAKKATEMALLNLGAMEFALEHYAEALSYYQRVHESHPQSPLWQITALEGMATANEHLGQRQKSIEILQEAIPAADKAAFSLGSARLWNELSQSQEETGQLAAALASENRALNIIHSDGGNPDYEWQVQSRMGHTLRALGQNQDALDHYQMAIDGIEHLRSAALDTEEGRAGVLAKTRAVYAETADLLVDLHRGADAFQVAEQGRARAFLEILAQARDGLPDQLTPEQQNREDALLARISSIQEGSWSEKSTAGEQLKRKEELAAAEQDLDALHVAVSRTNPRYASLRYPEPISVARAQSDLLGGQRILVEFLLGEKRSLVWVISRDRLSVGILPARQQIEKQIAAYRAVLSDRASMLTLQASQAEILRRGGVLYSTLFGPIANAIPAGSALIIVPDGVLDYLPFETLVTGRKHSPSGEDQPAFLLEKFPVVYEPSATALAELTTLNAQPARWDMALLAFGDPILASGPMDPDNSMHRVETRSAESQPAADLDRPPLETAYDSFAERGFSLSRLPFTRQEVLGIGSLFPASQRRVYLGSRATEEAMNKENLGQYRYIHFASHGFIDERMPELSGILFSSDPASHRDGVLDAGQIMRLRLNADMVTLSACSTGLGKLVDGEGMLGLTRAFFYAGARNVTVSLWNVNDAATATLMKSFYIHLKQGMSKSEALREAKLDLLKGRNSERRSSYFWGAFILVGSGN